MYDLIEKSCLSIINTLYHQTVFSIILFILLFGLSLLLKEKSPRWQLGLWFLILIRLILPTNLSLPFSARDLVDDFLITDSFNASIEKVSGKLAAIHQPSQNPIIGIPIPIEGQDSISTPASGEPNEDKDISLFCPVMLSISWILGCLVFLFLFLRRIRGVNRVLNHSLMVRDKEMNAFVDYWHQRFRITRPVAIFSSNEFLSPFTVGLFRPKIFIPESLLEDMDNETISSIIAHEMVHIKRFDHAWIRLQNVLQIIYFFNPVVWYANREINIARERVCDSFVLSKQAIPPKEYGESLIDVLKFNLSGYRLIEPLSCFSNHKRIFEYRIKDILKKKTMSKQKALLISLMICLFGLFILPMSSSQIDAKDSELSEEPLSFITQKSQTAIGSNKGDNEVQDDVITLRDSIGSKEKITGQKSEEIKTGDGEQSDMALNLLIDEKQDRKKGAEANLPHASTKNIRNHEEPLKLASNNKRVNSSEYNIYELEESEPEQSIESSEAVQQQEDSPIDYASRGLSSLQKGEIDDAISDSTEAIPERYKSLADQLEDAKTAFDNKDYEKANELLSPLAEEKDVEAQTRLGVMYVNGQGVEMDLTKGLRLIMEAANQGYDMAQACALDVSMDIARTGDTGAMYNVGGMCLKGWGGEQDKALCLKWLEEAARLGHINSAEILNKIYEKGQFGIPRDKEKAAEWKDVAEGFKKGIQGRWAEAPPRAMGDQPLYLYFRFKVKDKKLTGSTLARSTLAGPTQQAKYKKLSIEDGKIDGNNISFKVANRWDGMDVTHYYTGTFLGNALRLSYTTDMGDGSDAGSPMTFVAERYRHTYFPPRGIPRVWQPAVPAPYSAQPQPKTGNK
jgi:beta-lactamase regulating signal transducer with metallopeptidase domain/tetratricopeptide (TPR) repeat protein